MKSLLEALSRAIPDCKVGQLEKAVGAVLGADSVEFWYTDGSSQRPVGADAEASHILGSRPVRMQVQFMPANAAEHERVLTTQAAELRVQAATPATPLEAARPQIVRFIRDLDALESRSVNTFVWIKFLIQERIPQLGIPAQEANGFLDDLLREGIVGTKKVPNPNRPEFPSTGVVLNRTHPLVQQVLRNGRSPRRQPIQMPGGPLSDDIVRDRR